LIVTIKPLIHTALFLLLISLAGVSYAQIPQIERDALVALYNSTDGANWTDNTGWMGEAGTECDWQGITCSNDSVTLIRFYNNALTGTIPAELSNLKSLTSLNLGDNSLTGTIPSELSNLKSLTYLYLGLNSLTGTIPSELGNLTKLTQLLLFSNSLTGTIPSELGNLTNLTRLYLNNNSLTGSIPSELGNLTKLATFSYTGNSITGSIPNGLGSEGPKISSIERNALVALYNSTDGANWVDNSGWMGAAGTECVWFGVTCTSGSVETLYFPKNGLVGTIPKELGDLSNLFNLQLGGNELSGAIPKEIGNLTKLKAIQLWGNKLSGSIPKEFGNLLSLAVLNISSNELSGVIPSEMGNLANLATFQFTQNSITGGLPIGLGSALGGVSSEERAALVALYQSTDGDSWKNNYGWLGAEGTECSWYGVSCNSGSVSNLDLSRNSLVGVLPTEFGNLTELTFLNLGYNSVSGNITELFKNFTKLTYAQFWGGNEIDGVMPKELYEELVKDWSGPGVPWGSINLNNHYVEDIDRDGIDDEIDTDKNSPSMVKTIETSDYSISILGSGRVVNLVSNSTYKDEFKNFVSGPRPVVEDIKRITNILYENFEDEFDFIQIVPGCFDIINCIDKWGTYGVNYSVKNDVNGTGGDLYDNTQGYGSTGRLKSVSVFPHMNGATRGPSLHEFMHTWANRLTMLDPLRGTGEKGQDNFLCPGHWGWSNVGGQLGGWRPNSLERLSDGSYQAKGTNTVDFNENQFGSFAQGDNQAPYGNLELYMMGLIGVDEVGHDIKIAENFKWKNQTSGVFESTAINTVTMEEIIASEGSRIPSHVDSEKAFRTMYVVVSEKPLELNAWGYLDKEIYDFQLQGDDGNKRYNFWEATRGLATMTYDSADNFLKTQTTLNALVTSPVVSIVDGDKTIPDTDAAAGELVSLTATAIDANGSIVTTRWLVDGVEVGTGLSASFSLPNGPTVVTFQATDDDGESSAITATITVEAPNVSPVVAITGGDRTVADAAAKIIADKAAADKIVADAAAKIIADKAAADAAAKIVADKAAADKIVADAAAKIIADKAAADKIVADKAEWPSPYNGVTPDSSYGLEFNNVGVLNSVDATIYVCLRIFTDGLPSSVNGVSQFDMGLKVASLSEATVQITKFREFNAISALNEKGQTPDCSGIFETTTGVYTDIIQTDTSVLETTWNLIDPTNLILKLDSFKELTAN
jgi:hypothetical protein